MTDNKKQGRVYLVGAGPGRADLITVRGAEVLKLADCIVCDKLANPALLNYARRDAEIINVPKRIGEGSFTQEKINGLLIEKAKAGKVIARLKGGDPCMFGRGAEEAAVLAQAGIEFEIVPGVTAGIAAAEYSGIMLTARDYSSQVIFVSGREAEGKQKSNIDWGWLARFSGTIVLYMAMESLDFIVNELMRNGMRDDTPAAVIANATFPGQKIIESTIGSINAKCKKADIEPPAIVIIGKAADRNEVLDWFMKLPLFGKNIVITRDNCANEIFAEKIIAEGGNPIRFATIKIKPLTEGKRFLEALTKIAEYDWIIFTSENGVSIFFDCLRVLKKDARIFGSAKIAAIGSETAGRLGEFGINADFVPTVFTGRELGKQLIGFTSLQGKKILLLRSDIASKEIVELLTEAKASVEDTAIYTVETEKSDSEWLKKKLADGQIDWVTFASPSAVRGFLEQVPAELVNTGDAKIASIGPVTSEELKRNGLKVDAEAREHTIDGLLAAIKGAER
jgi:uroporphyrinogen III methyltransferase/synthase